MAADELEAPAVGPTSKRGRRRVSFRFWVALILVALAAIFIAQNRDRPRVHILWITVESPMWFILTVMLAVGILVGLLLRRRRRG
ncbi:lipopolysaccharide assembly protein LapA domain-containing protein [soil metagenome]